MTQALLLNVAIIIAVIVCMVVLKNPLALFALLLIKELPYFSLEQHEEGEEAQPMGFVQ